MNENDKAFFAFFRKIRENNKLNKEKKDLK